MTSASAAVARTAGLDLGRAALGVAIGLGLAGIAFDSGGYFPTAWSWGALVALTVIAAALVLGDAVRPSALALASLGGLAGLAAWTWLALLWSDDPAATVLEGQRMLLYVAVLAALVCCSCDARPCRSCWRRRSSRSSSRRATASCTRLFPERLGVYDSVAAHRLEEPLTYWNALGVFAGMGALLALGFTARGRSLAVQSARRGDAAAVLLDHLLHVQPRSLGRNGGRSRRRRRGRPAAGFSCCSRRSCWRRPRRSRCSSRRIRTRLTRTDAPLSAASHDGHQLAVYLLVLVAVSALVALGLALAERRIAPPRRRDLPSAARSWSSRSPHSSRSSSATEGRSRS